MKVFDHTDYRVFLRETLALLPARGRGELLKIAKSAGMHSSVLSQVFQGQRDLTNEQAVAVAAHLGLDENETLYFLLLTQFSRAGTERLKTLLQKQMNDLRDAQNQVENRVKPSRALSAEEKAVFYSNWFYSAMRVLSAIPEFQNKEALRKKVGLSPEKFRQILDFLLEQGLCQESEGKLLPAEQSTHIGGESPLVSRHHANWRLRAMEKHPAMDLQRELAFTSSMALSEKDVLRVRAKLLETIEEICGWVDPSPSEKAYFLNLDWLEI